MADEHRTIVRVLQYMGPISWLEQTLANSRIPIQGALNLPNGASIKSGVIVWQPDVVTEQQVDASQPASTNDNMPPNIRDVSLSPVKTVPFKRPGEA